MATNEQKPETSLPMMMPSPGDNDEWIMLEDWECEGITIKAGFVSDLDSVPRVPLVYSFAKGYARLSSLVHDWNYSHGTLPRKEADKLFLKMMRSLDNVGRIRSFIIYQAVRFFGKSHFKTANLTSRELSIN